MCVRGEKIIRNFCIRVGTSAFNNENDINLGFASNWHSLLMENYRQRDQTRLVTAQKNIEKGITMISLLLKLNIFRLFANVLMNLHNCAFQEAYCHFRMISWIFIGAIWERTSNKKIVIFLRRRLQKKGRQFRISLIFFYSTLLQKQAKRD